MSEYNLWRKVAHVIMLVSERLNISPKSATEMFYRSELCENLHDERNMLHCMSDNYLADELIAETKNNNERKHEKHDFYQ